ncbi:MAG TPA: hypothetical protein VGM78_08650 [Ilumatobacteraceae bacterium]
MNAPSPDDDTIDALARRAGAELRQPAPADITANVRRSRRRQLAVRSTAGGLGATALVALILIVASGTHGSGKVVTATTPTSGTRPTPTVVQSTTPSRTAPSADTISGSTTVATATSPTTTSPTIGSGASGPTIPPIGADADGLPDAIYAPADEGVDQLDVIDPVMLTVTDTIVAPVMEDDAVDAGVSASGAVSYGQPLIEDDLDACNQAHSSDWVMGASTAGLPDRVTEIVVAADGRTGAAISLTCPATGGVSGTAVAVRSSTMTVELFDPSHPDIAGRTVLTASGSDEAPESDSLALSDDGSYLLVTTLPQPAAEGNSTQIRIIDTKSGDVVAAIGRSQAGELPHAGCGLGFVSMRFVSSTALSYAAICDDGLWVVVDDLVTGQSFDTLQPAYAGRTYETMTTASLVVDRSTYTGPSSSWFILCASRETVQSDGTTVLDAPGSQPCWLGHGTNAMRSIPAKTTLSAGFTNPPWST